MSYIDNYIWQDRGEIRLDGLLSPNDPWTFRARLERAKFKEQFCASTAATTTTTTKNNKIS